MGRFRTPVAAVSALTAVVAIAVLAGCGPTAPVNVPTSTSTATATASASGTPTPAPTPTFLPKGSAQDNRAFFDYLNAKLITSNKTAPGRTIITNLVNAGFDKKAMQLTPDTTTIGRPVDSVIFSVRIGDVCLIGQRSATGYHSSTGPALENGSCIVGKTRPIDW